VNRYEFGAAVEDRTLVMGLRASQVALLGAGLTVAVGVFRASGGSDWPIATVTMEER